MWEGYCTTIPLPTYWWPRRDYTPRTTVRTTDATTKTLSTTFDLLPPLKEDRAQHCSLTWIVSCKGSGHNRHRQHHPTSGQPPAPSSPTHQSSKCRFLNGTGSLFYVSPRRLIPQRRSPPTLERLTARSSPLTDNCLIASTWDYAANTRSESVYPSNAIRSSRPRTLQPLSQAWATFPNLGAKLSFCLRVKGRTKLLNKIN
jgi:hypothetical protein